jgi:hypothetical protein
MNRQAIMIVGRLLALALISCAGCVDSTWALARWYQAGQGERKIPFL